MFEAGSPVYYYLPWGPLAVLLAVVTRAPRPALACLAVSIALKIVLITQINPVFRDPTATRDLVHDHAVLWAFGNGVVVIAVGAAILLIRRAATTPKSGPA
ncbi:hypothetical protein AB0A74_00065 [Saccharothrix sp. NPDC042600]|uniref:hypothetical protein n=1 Tax=Saccharothrix TaxID=2071 RepID=UPI0033F6ABAF|nr:hypothetical protein GCM10017745_46800 [Saccharothrix mutabilis subsp. capreolus]